VGGELIWVEGEYRREGLIVYGRHEFRGISGMTLG
jgi:hypothetical protein